MVPISGLFGLAAGSPIKWAQCEDDIGVFTLDFDETAGVPNPPTKGLDVSLNLIGVLSDTLNIDHVAIHTEWEGAPLYDEEKAVNNVFDDVLMYQMSWNVPTYAPEGDYVTTITGITTEGDSAFCVEAEFAFWVTKLSTLSETKYRERTSCALASTEMRNAPHLIKQAWQNL